MVVSLYNNYASLYDSCKDHLIFAKYETIESLKQRNASFSDVSFVLNQIISDIILDKYKYSIADSCNLKGIELLATSTAYNWMGIAPMGKLFHVVCCKGIINLDVYPIFEKIINAIMSYRSAFSLNGEIHSMYYL